MPGLVRLDWNLEYLQPPDFPIAHTADGKAVIARTLSYFDAVYVAARIKCPIWISVGLMDDVTPGVGVFSAFNAIPSPKKSLDVMPTTGHAGGVGPSAAQGVWP